MSRRRRARTLDAQERALWHHVIRSVTPLHPQAPPPEEAVPPAPPKPEVAPLAAAIPAPVAKPPPPLAALEPRMRRRLGRNAEVDARIDLHGLTQASAHRRLHAFVMEAQRLGHGLVLVITGKGAAERGLGERDGSSMHGLPERGVLRRAVPLWLADPVLRAFVVGFEPAAQRHGGEGALYVRIRRRRGDGTP
ncbi:Smr/MutS family protein [Aquabacter cavernae]|uniref:Smr/MutS family protein n=1 Tax=Aquabacter cavernae TaxID=2496029 RepID=UPI000F8CD62D|nr:Smr/MutS family protein [Aquabacter cavernae]